jgi:hypothetical protein
MFRTYIETYEQFCRFVFCDEVNKIIVEKENEICSLHEKIVTSLCSHIKETDYDFKYMMCDVPISRASAKLICYEDDYVCTLTGDGKIKNHHNKSREQMIQRFNLVTDEDINKLMCKSIKLMDSLFYDIDDTC